MMPDLRALLVVAFTLQDVHHLDGILCVHYDPLLVDDEGSGAEGGDGHLVVGGHGEQEGLELYAVVPVFAVLVPRHCVVVQDQKRGGEEREEEREQRDPGCTRSFIYRRGSQEGKQSMGINSRG